MSASRLLKKTYIVEKLLSDRINPVTKKREFFTKWVGWPHSDNTWEPISHFDDCPEVIEEYRSFKQVRKNKKKNIAVVKPRVTLKKNIVKKPNRVSKTQSITNGANESEGSTNQILIDSTNQKAKKQHAVSRKVMRRMAVSESESLNNSQERVPLTNGFNSSEAPNRNGFERGWTVEEIIGATDVSGEIEFLVKWRGHDVEELVPARLVRRVVPQLVIHFYERHTRWEEEYTNTPKK